MALPVFYYAPYIDTDLRKGDRCNGDSRDLSIIDCFRMADCPKGICNIQQAGGYHGGAGKTVIEILILPFLRPHSSCQGAVPCCRHTQGITAVHAGKHRKRQRAGDNFPQPQQHAKSARRPRNVQGPAVGRVIIFPDSLASVPNPLVQDAHLHPPFPTFFLIIA